MGKVWGKIVGKIVSKIESKIVGKILGKIVGKVLGKVLGEEEVNEFNNLRAENHRLKVMKESFEKEIEGLQKNRVELLEKVNSLDTQVNALKKMT